MVPTLYQVRVDSHCAHHLIQLRRGQNEIEFKGICVGRADGWMEGGGYWLRAWVAVDDKWPTKTKTSQLAKKLVNKTKTSQLWRGKKMIGTALNFKPEKGHLTMLKHPRF